MFKLMSLMMLVLGWTMLDIIPLGTGVIAGARKRPIRGQSLGSPAVGTNTMGHAAAATSATVTTVVSTGFTQPTSARNVTATSGGTAGDIKNVAVTVVGTNISGQPISEVLPAFTLDTPGTVTGNKAFASITSYSVPAMDGPGATVALGYGAKLGLPVTMNRNAVQAAYLNGVKEGTAPTVVNSATVLESNTATLNSALNGTEVLIDIDV